MPKKNAVYAQLAAAQRAARPFGRGLGSGVRNAPRLSPHAAQHVTSLLVANLRGATDPVPFMNEYYLLSVLTFGTVMAVVRLITRGRLGSSK